MIWMSSWNTPATTTAVPPQTSARRRRAGAQDSTQPSTPSTAPPTTNSTSPAWSTMPERQHLQQVWRQRNEHPAKVDAQHRPRPAAASGNAETAPASAAPSNVAAPRGRCRAAKAPAPMPIASSVAWPRDSASTMIQRWCSIGSNPTIAKCNAMTPKTQPTNREERIWIMGRYAKRPCNSRHGRSCAGHLPPPPQRVCQCPIVCR